MRITLTKYISKEIWSVFSACLFVFIFIIMTVELHNKTDLMINYGVGPGELLKLLLCLFPRIILTAMPVACLMAVLLSFIRMSSDNEIIALHSSGISLYQLMPPVIIFSGVCLLIAAFLTFFGAPYGNRAFSNADFVNVMKSKMNVMIREGVFEEYEDFVIYAGRYSKNDDVLHDVFIVDKRKGREETIIAERAKIRPLKDGIVIIFYKGETFMEGEDADSTYGHSDFDETSIVIKDKMFSESSDEKKSEPDELYFGELREYIYNSGENTGDMNIARLTLHEMFTVPLSIFFIGIAGAPLGAHIRAQGRTKGIIISLLLFLGYYIIFMLSKVLCESGLVFPAMGAWLPVLFLLIICVFLLTKSDRELSFGVLNRLLKLT